MSASVITMGSKVEALKDGAWVPGTVLGVHQDAFDVLYEGGEGDMMKPSAEVRISASAEAGVGISSAEKKKKKKSSSIGWNASAFADEGEAVLEESGGGEEVGVEAKKVSAPVVSVSVKKDFNPMVGDKVECRDFVSKEWKTARVVGMDEELKTFDVRFEDGVDAKGVPQNLLRERQKRKKRSKSSASGGGGASAGSKENIIGISNNNNNDGVSGSSASVSEITGLCKGLNQKQLLFVRDMIRGIKEL
ncbi:hypothetical protein TrVE_jg579 [Triparma verrucosa]|uniref:Tudor domain-containing protein n=1 Tax=Triparma verrucosa TaxID=1606542 RepID=A0A9W7C525_9STRA|nr:hypothetical protein TrVE_jg579 [Triparma verrucosa]